MNVLFDQGTPVPLRRYLPDHRVATSYELGWSTLANGQLLSQAEEAGFELLVSTDQNLRYQQNLTTRQIAIVVVRSTSWPRIQRRLEAIRAAVDRAGLGTYEEVDI